MSDLVERWIYNDRDFDSVIAEIDNKLDYLFRLARLSAASQIKPDKIDRFLDLCDENWKAMER